MARNEIFSRYQLFIFDADDTLRSTIVPGQPCPRARDEWVLLPGVRKKLSPVRWNREGGPMLGIASNQDQVGYGHLSLDTARELLRDLARGSAGVDLPDPALQLCPHRLEVNCRCRKPSAGMLNAIMEYYRVGPNDTLFVGNHEADRQAAAEAGTAFVWAEAFFADSERGQIAEGIQQL
jgi:D-glycero-D-manno-heptose 1,7-bisphosphate phosphatase